MLSRRNDKRYIIRTSKKAIYIKNSGFLCDCGKWTTGDDAIHIPRIKGIREEYKSIKRKSGQFDYNNIG